MERGNVAVEPLDTPDEGVSTALAGVSTTKCACELDPARVHEYDGFCFLKTIVLVVSLDLDSFLGIARLEFAG